MKKLILVFGVLFSEILFGQKINVLNFATFHMAYTPDANKVKFDENDKRSKDETFAVAKMLSEFNPTIICVERTPGETEDLNLDYSNYLKSNDYKTRYGGEISLIAYQVGKLSGIVKIYCIDEQETAQYNYNIGNELKNQVDSLTSKNYMQSINRDFERSQELSTLNKLKEYNTKDFQDKLININADILTYNSTKNNFEGADEASKFYRRNLRIFSNLNQIPVKSNERILIIMGAAHTAFLNEFMERSPKYQLNDVSKYLK